MGGCPLRHRVCPASSVATQGRGLIRCGRASAAKEWGLSEHLTAQCIVDGFNIFNRTNIRAVNPNYQRVAEPLAAFDPRQIQTGFRLLF
jgi:hypothetical protein